MCMTIGIVWYNSTNEERFKERKMHAQSVCMYVRMLYSWTQIQACNNLAISEVLLVMLWYSVFYARLSFNK